jgi:hypothetical protein
VTLHAASLAGRHYGPLSSAVARLGEPLTPPNGGEGDGATLLGPLLDLRGSVELAAILDRGTFEATDAADDGEPRAPASDSALVRARHELVEELAEVRARLDYAFSRWTAASSKVAGPDAVAAALATRALLGPRERRTTTIAQAVWGPIADEARRELALARSSVRQLRQQLVLEIASTSPRAARLCALDRALCDAIETAVTAQLEKLMSATEARLVNQLGNEIAALPAGDSATVIDAWLAPDGSIRRGLALFSGVVHAAVESEERRLLALVDGAA